MSTVQEPFGLSLTFTWDALGRRTKMEDSLGGVTTSTYDVLGQQTKREFGGSGQTPLRIDLTYTVEGQQESITRYSDLAGTTMVARTSYTYDAADRLGNLHHRKGSDSSTIANYTYTYDSHSRLTAETGNGTATTYTYDDTDQLTGDGTNVATWSISSSPASRTTATLSGTSATTLAPFATSRIIAAWSRTAGALHTAWRGPGIRHHVAEPPPGQHPGCPDHPAAG